jgi:hypothetical protein
MARRKLTIADLSEITGYSRDQVRGLLDSLPPYVDHPSSPRIAREFTRHDLLVLSVVVRLETKHGLKRSAVASVVEQIQEALRGPRSGNLAPMLRISLFPPSVTSRVEKYIDEEGTVVALDPILQQVDSYLDGEVAETNRQPSLPFGPSLASHRRHG